MVISLSNPEEKYALVDTQMHPRVCSPQEETEVTCSDNSSHRTAPKARMRDGSLGQGGGGEDKDVRLILSNILESESMELSDGWHLRGKKGENVKNDYPVPAE